MEPTRTEIDTFKVMSNVDFVDWSKASNLGKSKEPQVELDEDDNESEEMQSVKKEDKSDGEEEEEEEDKRRKDDDDEEEEKQRNEDEDDEEEKKTEHSDRRSSRDSQLSNAERAAQIPLPSSTRNSVSPPQSPKPSSMPKRTLPVPKKYSASEENDDYEVLAEKEALLQDLLSYERPPHNVKLTRQWNVKEHTLDELQFEYDRIQSELNANQMVDMAKSGIKFGVGGLEMMMKQSGFNAVDGWYKNSCADMSKYNRPLLKLYKRYWRKTTMSPIMELGFLLFGGLAWTVAENKMGLRGAASAAPAAIPTASIPRAAEYEPSAKPAGGMRPPSMVSKGPRWTDTPTPLSSPAAPAPAPAPSPSPAPAPAPTDPALLATLQNLSQQNTAMLQVLQNMQLQQNQKSAKSSPATSRRSSLSSAHSQLRISLPLGRRTPLKRAPATARSTRSTKRGSVEMLEL